MSAETYVRGLYVVLEEELLEEELLEELLELPDDEDEPW
jgi:hypothetical protein